MATHVTSAGGPHRAPLRGALAAGLAVAGLAAAAILLLVLLGRPASASASCTIYWTGATSSSWSDGTNWSLTDGGTSAGRVPGSGDYVCMSTSPATATVTMDAASATVAGVDWPSTNSSSPSLTVDGGDQLTLGEPGATPASTVDSLTVDGTLTNEDPLSLSSAALSGADLVNDGTLSLPSASVDLASASVLENASGGTIKLVDGTTIGAGDATANVLQNDNGATINYSGGAPGSSASVAVTLDDAGTTSVSTGQLLLTGGGTLEPTAAATAASGGQTVLQSTFTAAAGGGSLDGFVLAGGTLLGGGGTFAVGGGQTFVVGTGAFGGGSLAGGAVVVNHGTLRLSGGETLQFNGASSVENASGAQIVFSDGSDLAPNDATANVVTNDTGGTLAYAGTSANQTATIGVPLVDDGAASVTGGTLDVTGGATFGAAESASGAGVFALDSQAVPATGGGALTGVTIGVFGALSGPGTLTLPAGKTITWQNGGSLVNGADVLVDGTLDVPGGLNWHGGSLLEIAPGGAVALVSGSDLEDLDGNSSNLLKLDAGGAIAFTGIDSTSTSTIGETFHDAGTLTSSIGTLVVTSQVTAYSTASASGGGVVEITGAVRPDPVSRQGSIGGLTAGPGGSFVGPGTLTVPAGATVHFASPSAFNLVAHVVNLGRVTFDDNATINWDGGSVFENGSGGRVTVSDGATLQSEDLNTLNLLANDAGGTISYAGSTSTQSASLTVPVRNAGTISVSDGTLSITVLDNLSAGGSLAGGAYAATAPAGTLSLPVGVRSVAAGTALTVGAGGRVLTSGANALAGLGTNAGTLTFGGAEAVGNLASTGTVNLTSGTLATASFSQTKGLTVVGAGATLKAGSTGTGTIRITGGTVKGGGTLAGAATLTGTLEVDVHKTAPTLSVTRQAAVGGTLAIVTSATPASGTTLTALKSAALSGFFAAVAGGHISGSLWYAPSYSSTAVFLRVGPPAFTVISPNHVGQGASSFPVTLTGAGFAATATVLSPETGVSFSSVKVAASGSTITARVTVASSARTGVLSVKVSQPGTALTCGSCLVVDPGPRPASVSPSSAVRGAKGVTVKIAGSAFAAGATVSFNSSAISVQVVSVSATLLTVKITVSASAPLAKYTVTVRNRDGGTGSLAGAFQVT